MADKKISELVDVPTLDGTEMVELVTGGTNKRALTQAIADLVTVPDLASQAEAEAGVENTKIMTALRTAQAIAALGGGGGVGYLEYVVLLKQTGTSAPVATVLKNDLAGTPVWTRIVAGQYRCTLANAFTLNKTVCIEGALAYGDSMFADPVNASVIDIYTSSGGVGYDDLLGGMSAGSKTPLIVRVYP